VQSDYRRKNWSSLMLWDLRMAGSRRLRRVDANTRPGLWLHQLGWLFDREIGELPPAWNWLEGSSDPASEPKAVHYTRGTPDMAGYRDAAYAAEWLGHCTLEEGIDVTQSWEGPCCKPANCATA
jgi:hypothetical protein